MKKKFEIAFAIALLILALISTIFPAGLMENIVYAVVLPAFVLSIISFVTELSASCTKSAETLSDAARKISEYKDKTADTKLEMYNNGLHELPFVEGFVPNEITEIKESSVESMHQSALFKEIQVSFVRMKRVCDIITIVGYVLLLLSLCLSPWIMEYLSSANLNCLTLWSLAVMYLTMELKDDCSKLLLNILYKKHTKVEMKNNL